MSPLPNLVIPGVGKAGTTSLHWYLSQHQDICAATVKEVRYFRPLVEGRGPLPPVSEYAAHYAHCSGERYRLDASPQYFHGGRPVTDAIQALLGEPKVIVMLRDPVSRLWSLYRFMRARLADLPNDMTFDGYIDRCLEVRDRGEAVSAANRRYFAIQGSFYAEYVDPWVDAFGSDLRITFFERLVESPEREFIEVCEWLGLDADPATISFSVENQTVPVRSAMLQRIALAANSERVLRNRRRLKMPLRKLYYAMNRQGSAERMLPATRQRLEEIFAPGNAALAELVRSLGYRDLPQWLYQSSSE